MREVNSVSSDKFDALREQERQLLEVLEQLRRSYVEAAQPYIQRLHTVRAVLYPPRIFITEAEAQALGVIP